LKVACESLSLIRLRELVGAPFLVVTQPLGMVVGPEGSALQRPLEIMGLEGQLGLHLMHRQAG
jgi:hypothetical protein